MESTEVSVKYNHQVYSVMEYFGYLRRQPDGGYLAWISCWTERNDPRGMVTGFVNSIESIATGLGLSSHQLLTQRGQAPFQT